MRSFAQQLIVAGLAACFIVTWGARSDQDVVMAQRRTPAKMTRLYTDSNGQARAEEVELKLTTNTRGTAESSEMIKVTGLQFTRTPPNSFSDWHNAPRRQYIITLSGRREVEVADGKKVVLEPCGVLLAEDLTGKGHITRGAGTEDSISLTIPLAN